MTIYLILKNVFGFDYKKYKYNSLLNNQKYNENYLLDNY